MNSQTYRIGTYSKTFKVNISTFSNKLATHRGGLHFSWKASIAEHRPPLIISTSTSSVFKASSGFLYKCIHPSYSRIFRPHRKSVLRSMCPARCHLSLALLQAMSVSLVLQITLFLNWSWNKTNKRNSNQVFLVNRDFVMWLYEVKGLSVKLIRIISIMLIKEVTHHKGSLT